MAGGKTLRGRLASSAPFWRRPAWSVLIVLLASAALVNAFSYHPTYYNFDDGSLAGAAGGENRPLGGEQVHRCALTDLLGELLGASEIKGHGRTGIGRLEVLADLAERLGERRGGEHGQLAADSSRRWSSGSICGNRSRNR